VISLYDDLIDKVREVVVGKLINERMMEEE